MQLVSIIVPVFNAEKYIERIHQQLTNQTYQNIEIIYVNDGSLDDSLIILNSLTSKNLRIKIIDQENSGPSTTRNVGLAHATGDFILFVDVDDFIELTIVEKMVATMNSQQADVVICNYKDVLPNGEVARVNKVASLFEGHTIQENPKLLFIKPAVWNKMIRKEIITYNNIKFPHTYIGEDLVFTIKVLANAKKVVGIPDPLYHYVLHQNTISRTYSAKVLDLLKSLDELYNYFEQKGLISKYKEEIDYISIQNILYQITKVPLIEKDKEIVYKALVDYLNKIDTLKSNKYVKDSLVYSILVRFFPHKIFIFNPISQWGLKQMSTSNFVYRIVRKLDK